MSHTNGGTLDVAPVVVVQGRSGDVLDRCSKQASPFSSVLSHDFVIVAIATTSLTSRVRPAETGVVNGL